MENKQFDEQVIRQVIEKHYKDFGVYRFISRHRIARYIIFYLFLAIMTADFILPSLTVPAPFYVIYFLSMFLTAVVAGIDHFRIGRMIYKIYNELNYDLEIYITYKNVCELIDEYLKSKK